MTECAVDNDSLDDEIEKAKINKKSIIIALDANSKLGNSIIPSDPHSQSPNGKLLSEILLKHNLIVANSLPLCKGLITRQRVTINGIEKSVIDFVIFSEI